MFIMLMIQKTVILGQNPKRDDAFVKICYKERINGYTHSKDWEAPDVQIPTRLFLPYNTLFIFIYTPCHSGMKMLVTVKK